MRENKYLEGNTYDAMLSLMTSIIAVILHLKNGIKIPEAMKMIHNSEKYKFLRIPESGEIMEGQYWVYMDICNEYGITPAEPSNDEMPFAYYHELFLRNNVFEAYCSFLGDNVSGREMEKLFTDAGIYDYLFKHCRKYKKKDPYETAFVIADKFRKKIPKHLMIKRPEVMPVNDFEW